tara:strand:+ start:103 stop:288 length:186 start_codon:yes stop_codon:yes gene_type:complete
VLGAGISQDYTSGYASGSLQSAGDFPITEKVANLCLSLPMSPYLSVPDQDKVIEAILTYKI